jgi:hypothetical protein
MMTTKISADLHARVLAAESQLQIESPDVPEGKPVKARKTCKLHSSRSSRRTKQDQHTGTTTS